MNDSPGPTPPDQGGGPGAPGVPWDRDPASWFDPPADIPKPVRQAASAPHGPVWATAGHPHPVEDPWYDSTGARFALATALAAIISVAFILALLTGRWGADPGRGQNLLTGPVQGASVFEACTPSRPAAATVLESTLSVGGLDRQYRLHLPLPYDGGEQVPLVLLFHGTAGTIAGIEEYTRFTDAAVRRGYAVATLQATGQQDAGVPAHWTVPGFDGPDDVAFAEAVVREVESSACIDPRRVYATGISSGGAFSAFLGCRSELFAAVAPVAGMNLVRPCPSGAPLAVLSIHGTADPFVPYAGLDASLDTPGEDFYLGPILDSAAAWAQRDGCGRQEEVQIAFDVRSTAWVDCADGTAVVLWTVEGGGHTWPGTEARDAESVGATTASIDANTVILDFFDTHRLIRAPSVAAVPGPSTSATPTDQPAADSTATEGTTEAGGEIATDEPTPVS